MKILACIVACAFVATSMAQLPTTPFEVVPMASTLCSIGCPQLCESLSATCIDINGVTSCESNKAKCDSACNQTCSCINECGPNCDVFEGNCANLGFPIVGGVFCPIPGYICDINCLAQCNQQSLMSSMTQVFSNVPTSVQTFVSAFVRANRPFFS